MNNPSTLETEAPELTPLQAFLVLIGAVVVLAVIIAIYLALDIHAIWAGFLFLTYWSGIDDFAFDRLLPNVCGGFFGLLLVGSLSLLQAHLGNMGIVIFLSLLLGAIYCLIMKWAQWLINTFAMILLTVGLAPAVQADFNLLDALLAFSIAVIYFGGPVAAVHLLKKNS